MPKKLKEIRRDKAFTQDQLAVACGVDRATVSKWEKGEFLPRAGKLRALADALGVTVDELLREKE